MACFWTCLLCITAAIDEETRYLDRLESKIRRPSATSVDAEEISEQMDVSVLTCIQDLTLVVVWYKLLPNKFRQGYL